jgi:hypothetical protein
MALDEGAFGDRLAVVVRADRGARGLDELRVEVDVVDLVAEDLAVAPGEGGDLDEGLEERLLEPSRPGRRADRPSQPMTKWWVLSSQGRGLLVTTFWKLATLVGSEMEPCSGSTVRSLTSPSCP